MKNSLFIILIFSAANIAAQTSIEKSLSSTGAEKVVLDFKFANQVVIKVSSQEEVKLTASVSINNGQVDERYVITATRIGDELSFFSNADDLEEYWKNDYQDDCCSYGSGTTINIEVEMPSNLDLEFHSISGDIEVPALDGRLALNTISGNITIASQEYPILAKTISGDVELLVQEPSNADFQVKTISGEVYSNLDFEYLNKQDGLRQLMGQNVEGRLNQGGVKWELETISGDIFLREI